MRTVKISGNRGNWFARVGEESLPVLHQTWWNGTAGYHDEMRGVKLDGKKYRDLITALQTGKKIVMQRDKPDGSLARNGYVGVFSYSDFQQHTDGGISLTVGEQLAVPLK